MLLSLQQYSDFAFLFLRIVIAAIFIYHAIPKLRSPQGMAQGMGWPSGAVMFLGTVEFLSALSVLLGVYLQAGAFLLMLVMMGAMKMKMMNWKAPFSANDKTGWEFDLTLFAVNLVLLITGGGMLVLIR